MELPHLGKNCALRECNRLDFLPVKCDACSETFCIEHYKYETHNCEKSKNRNVQVPVCPLCSEPVVGKRNELPDVAVSQHIDKYCKKNNLMKSRPAKPKTNLQACNFKSCKQKDLIYLECKDCFSKFCIKHRHPTDHSCPGPSRTANLVENWNNFKGSCSSSASTSYEIFKNKAQQIGKSGQAALNRIANGTGARNRANNGIRNQEYSNNLQATSTRSNLSEQEALALALSESLKATSGNSQQEAEDLALAKAIHESEIEARNSRPNGSTKDNCILS